MTDYSSLSIEPKQFLALTGYTVAEFDALLPTFAIVSRLRCKPLP